MPRIDYDGGLTIDTQRDDGPRGVTRFLAAHSPTVRATVQTYDIAARLHRGESLHGED